MTIVHRGLKVKVRGHGLGWRASVSKNGNVVGMTLIPDRQLFL